ncbi:MAG: pyridoxal phosphate-dependent aminotransferase [Planctomycetes bacterium]|nr:pyridoxal phosphate-dependent aminotransferase [Planctomycetota bacterium]
MRFSPRTPSDFTPNPLARLLAAKRRAGTPVLDLTESNPTRAGFAYPEREILAALADPAALRYEPAPRGPLAARVAVADYYRARGLAVDPEQVVLAASTSEAYSWLFKLLAAPGDRVLVPQPSYPLFDSLAALEGLVVDHYPLRAPSWRIDAAALRAAVAAPLDASVPASAAAPARVLVAVSPNNPTGSCLTPAEARLLLELSATHGLGLVVDEVFADYPAALPTPPLPPAGSPPVNAGSVDGATATLLAADRGLLFLLNGLSKVCGLPQLKLGWIVLAGDPALRAAARARLEMIADTYLSVNTPVAAALPRLLALRGPIQEQLRARVAANRAALTAACAIRYIPDSCAPPAEAGWYALLRLPDSRSDEEWALALLEQDDVHLHPGFLYGIEEESWLVAGLLTHPDVFRPGIERVLARASQG